MHFLSIADHTCIWKSHTVRFLQILDENQNKKYQNVNKTHEIEGFSLKNTKQS